MDAMTHNKWTAGLLADGPDGASSLVMSVFGDTIGASSSSVPMSSLIALLAPFNVNERLLRTNVFRLVQKGWLKAQRSGRCSTYSVDAQALQRFRDAFARIDAPQGPGWDGRWSLVVSLGDNLSGPQAAELRVELLAHGYRPIAPGIFGRPAVDAKALDALFTRLGVRGKLFAYEASPLDGVGQRPLNELAEASWDLREITARYDEFVEQFAPILQALSSGMPVPAREAFIIRTLMMRNYRRVRALDPGLPHELLPQPWAGARAYELCVALNCLTFAGTEQFVDANLEPSSVNVAASTSPPCAQFGHACVRPESCLHRFRIR